MVGNDATSAARKLIGSDQPTTRAELYEQAKRLKIRGRSKMGRSEREHAMDG